MDWAQDVVVRGLDEAIGDWNAIFEQCDIPEPVGISRFDLGDVEARDDSIEIRKSGADRWWLSWNVALTSPSL
jgi:hypothetical protein